MRAVEPVDSCYVPPVGFHIRFHQFVFAGKIFFDPRIFHAPFEVEHISGVFLKKCQVPVDGVPDIAADGGLYVLFPLGVEMCVRYEIDAGSVFSVGSRGRYGGGNSNSGDGGYKQSLHGESC